MYKNFNHATGPMWTPEYSCMWIIINETGLGHGMALYVSTVHGDIVVLAVRAMGGL